MTPELRKISADIVQIAKKQIDIAFRFKLPRLAEIKKIEDAYQNKVPRTLKNRFNIPLPIISGFINTFQAKIDEFPTVNFDRIEEADYKVAKKLTEVWKAETGVNRGNWQAIDRMAKRFAMFSGRAIYKYYPSNEPEYKSNFEAIDYYDFGAEPSGGNNLDNHLFHGQINVYRSKKEIEDGVKSSFYDKEGASTILNTEDKDKQVLDLYFEKNNRLKALGLSLETNDFVGTSIYNLTEWVTTYEGEKYYLFFDYQTGAVLRLEKLSEMFYEGLTPFVSWATDEDSSNFWNKSPAEDIYPVSESMRILFNEALDNLQKRGWNMRAFDINVFDNPSMLNWQPDGNVPVDLPAGRALQTAIMDLKTEDNTIAVRNLMLFTDNFLGQKTGITPASQGQASEDRVGIYYGNVQEAADRIDFISKMYREAYAKIGCRFMYGLKEYLNEPYAVKIIGANGVEWDELRKSEITKFNISITGGNEEKRLEDVRKQKQAQALDKIVTNPNISQKINPNWLVEAILKEGDYSDDEIKNALDVNNSGDQEILSEAAQAIQEIMKRKKPKINRGATTRFIQKIIDFATDNNVKDDIYQGLMDYAKAHLGIAQENMNRKVLEIKEQQAVNSMEQPQNTLPPVSPRAPQSPPEPINTPTTLQTSQNISNNLQGL